MDIRQKRKEHALSLSVHGPMTVEDATELHQALRDAVSSSDIVVINLEETSDIDLASLQLLCSAHKTALKKKKDLRFINLASEVRERIDKAGYIHNRGCLDGGASECLWMLQNPSGPGEISL